MSSISAASSRNQSGSSNSVAGYVPPTYVDAALVPGAAMLRAAGLGDRNGKEFGAG